MCKYLQKYTRLSNKFCRIKLIRDDTVLPTQKELYSYEISDSFYKVSRYRRQKSLLISIIKYQRHRRGNYGIVTPNLRQSLFFSDINIPVKMKLSIPTQSQKSIVLSLKDGKFS